MQHLTTFAAVTAAVVLTAGAHAAITITQGSSAPTYTDHDVNFDEAGAPTGAVGDPFTYYQGSDGISFGSGNGFLGVEDWDTLEGIDGGEGDGNQLAGGFSVRMLFDEDINEISWQGWANGSAAPPFGGINVFVFKDDVQIASYTGISPFGGVGDEWFNISGDEGFDEIRFFNGAFNSFTTFVDNISWSNPIPAPGAIALFGLAGLAGTRRRRA